jgi:hypothetical protein
MPNPSLKKFRDYLSAGAQGARTIKANDLDWNFKCSTVSKSSAAISLYDVSYTSEGTELTFKAGDKTAKWIEIDICVSGVMKKMMVLGTDPY